MSVLFCASAVEPAAPDRPLRIAVIAHLRHPIAEPFMGGMEAHCALLVRTLQAAGHEALLYASADSDPTLPLRAPVPAAYEATLPWAHWHGSDVLADWLERAYAAVWADLVTQDVDVVHNNALFAPLHDWAQRDGVPMVTSLHVPPFERLSDAVRRNPAPWLRLTVTSEAQLALWGWAAEGRVAVAYNGIDLSRWRYTAVAGRRALWCGRITPNKGTAEALRAATAAGIPLDVAGPVDCSDYFAELAPLLKPPHRYLGHLSGPAIVTAMQTAAVLVCTPRWEEPFGLVAAEALACGTPVAALDRGALREVIGPCGALADDEGGLAAAIDTAAAYPRELCRRRAERLFGADAMVRSYETAYAAAVCASASSMSRTRALLA